MGINERREKEKEAIKKKIIDATNVILEEEGYENLSIRKIAAKIEYSPGIIYHYFKDKNEIVTLVVEDGYRKILSTIAKISVDIENPDKTIEKGLRAYIDMMLQSPQKFKAVLMNDIENVQHKVNILDEGISGERKSIQHLCKLIELGIEKGKFKNLETELTAQIIWTSTYGLLCRLILEKNVSKHQKERLINHHFEVIIKGILK